MERADSRTFFECGACLGDCRHYDAERARADAAWAATRRYLNAYLSVPRIGPGVPVCTEYLVFRAALAALQARHGPSGGRYERGPTC
jgi:hypothetical protein